MNNKKQRQLEQFKVNDQHQGMTTNQGLKISNDEHSLKVGERGPTLLEDFHLREKITHFDHERIPERVVHARGAAAHGIFESYANFENITIASFLSEKGKKTPVFVRFSTVAGSRGSADTVRDVRGFATKFYTEEGNYDLVGNNIPVFFIQDGIKFPDLIHAVKPEPHNEIPQAQSAHDTFWDFIAHNEETAHMVMWHLSDRAIPRSYRMMEGFGVNTFRFINKDGKAHFVKFHWKPKLGLQSFIWDEAQKIAGKDPDFHRRDLFNAIEQENFPQYELCVQLIPQELEHSFDFDVLDPTKIWPEEEVPIQKIGMMTLTKNVDNYFAETEQVAFHPGHIVSGIDFSNDPLLQGRLFSYTDTQLLRLGGPNFHEIPINKPICPFFNNQRDGYHRQTINTSRVSYHKNSLQHNTPAEVPAHEGGYTHFEEKITGSKVRARSDSFANHYTQARMFWLSMTSVEQQHIINAFNFELGKVQSLTIRQQVVNMFAQVCRELAKTVAQNIGVEPPDDHIQPVQLTKTSPSLSMYRSPTMPHVTKKVGIIINVDEPCKIDIAILERHGLTVEFVSHSQSIVKGKYMAHTFETTDAVLYDALYVVAQFEDERSQRKAQQFIDDTYNHYKSLGFTLQTAQERYTGHEGVTHTIEDFIAAIQKGRHFNRSLATG